MSKNTALDKAFRDAKLWRQEAQDLRQILLACGLAEERKWGKPCYTAEGKNICIIQRMKGFLALLFFKGALLKDPDGVLEVQGRSSRAGYRIRFTSVEEVAKRANAVKRCVREAIAVEKAGLKMSPAPEPDYPEELIARMEEDAELGEAFHRLTPGRKRGYVLHISEARQPKTRLARIDRHRERILHGKGFNER